MSNTATAATFTKQTDGFYTTEDWAYTIERIASGEWKLRGPLVRTDYPFGGTLSECKREGARLAAQWAA